MRSGALALQPLNFDAVLADCRFERLDPAAEHLFQLGELFSRRTRVFTSGRELVEEIFVEHASVAAQFVEPAVRAGTELCQARLQGTELCLDAVEPLVDSRERLIDSIEPFFGHASLRPPDDPSTPLRADDDTSSCDGLEEQSVCRGGMSGEFANGAGASQKVQSPLTPHAQNLRCAPTLRARKPQRGGPWPEIIEAGENS
jgi:hypothetical protein